MPPRGAVFVVLWMVACGKHPWQTFWLKVVGNCLHPWQFVLTLGVEKWHPVVLFWCFVGKFPRRWQKRAGGVFWQIAIKKPPRGGKNALFGLQLWGKVVAMARCVAHGGGQVVWRTLLQVVLRGANVRLLWQQKNTQWVLRVET